ncbi:MAG: hypothetical protein H7Z17_09430 [Fuerstia sp.]|nr:hypothetical protein [Fuerstiella sp.]
MSLPTCPSCGQSVLEDDAVDCPFCGAAMDGSRGAKNTPKPQAGPAKHRPGAKPVAPPAPTSNSGSASGSAAKPGSPSPTSPARPASGAASSRTKVDEDDPFGIGNAAATQSAIQATERPDKTRLHKVTCPMCEQVGFVPKSAVGKSVRCANEKCMVPIFKALDSGENTNTRKPARMSDDAAAAKKAAETSQPTKRNPIVIYAIVGGVLLALTAGFLAVVNRRPVDPNLNAPIQIPRGEDWETEDETELRLAAEKAAAEKAAAAVPNPRVEVAAMATQMITLARQSNVRDNAWARRMTADLFLRTEDASLAAQELKHLGRDRTTAFYRIEPQITQYWKHSSAGAEDLAKASLALAMADQGNIPKTGRAGTEAALSLASVLVTEGKVSEARALVATRQLDTTIIASRDMLASVAWFWIADHSRDGMVPVPLVTDVLLWSQPLDTAVACDLALHQRWAEAIAWSIASEDSGVVSESLTEVATIAGAAKAPAAVFEQIAQAIPPGKPVVAVQVQAALAAASKNAAQLEAAITALAELPAPEAMKMPTTQEIVDKYGSERRNDLLRAAAVAEIVRAALICGDAEKAESQLARLRAELNAAAPSTREIRVLTLEVSRNESAARQRIAGDLRTSNSDQVDTAFKEYRRHLTSDGNQKGLFVIAEDRRLRAIRLLCRIIRAGGATVVQSALNDAASGWADEVMLDDLAGLLAAATLQSKQTLPEVMQPNPALKMDRIEGGYATLVERIAPVLASAWANRDKQRAEALKALESGCGPELPGLRQAYVNELVASMAGSTADPEYVLKAIGSLQNPVWREEAYLIAGRNFANRKMEAAVGKWIASQRLLGLEQISLMYGMAQVITNRVSESPK